LKHLGPNVTTLTGKMKIINTKLQSRDSIYSMILKVCKQKKVFP